MPTNDISKRAAGKRAAALVENGMKVGLGTGSTTAFALEEIARRIREDGLQVIGVPTSTSAEHSARRLGIPLSTLDELDELDVAIDGADEVDPELNLIKGRGAAHTREKVVASLARRFVILVDESKLVDRLGTQAPVPVEVLPMAAHPVMLRLQKLGAEIRLRIGERKDGPVVTDQGFWIIDARFNGIADPSALDQAIKQIPGVLDHGIFVGMATDVIVGNEEGSVRLLALDGVR